MPPITAPPTSPPVDDALDPTQEARYGSPELTSGFLPDPMEIRVMSGGPIDTHYLGGGCTGYAEPNPDVKLYYTSGGATLLRIYFVADSAGDDATLIINDTSANYVCNDDSYTTSNPTIDFGSPSGGRYDIWIGSYTQGAYVAGTLYITEIDSNHP